MNGFSTKHMDMTPLEFLLVIKFFEKCLMIISGLMIIFLGFKISVATNAKSKNGDSEQRNDASLEVNLSKLMVKALNLDNGNLLLVIGLVIIVFGISKGFVYENDVKESNGNQTITKVHGANSSEVSVSSEMLVKALNQKIVLYRNEEDKEAIDSVEKIKLKLASYEFGSDVVEEYERLTTCSKERSCTLTRDDRKKINEVKGWLNSK